MPRRNHLAGWSRTFSKPGIYTCHIPFNHYRSSIKNADKRNEGVNIKVFDVAWLSWQIIYAARPQHKVLCWPRITRHVLTDSRPHCAYHLMSWKIQQRAYEWDNWTIAFNSSENIRAMDYSESIVIHELKHLRAYCDELFCRETLRPNLMLDT